MLNFKKLRQNRIFFSVQHLLTLRMVSWFWWLVTPEIGRVREGIYKILFLLLKARELPGVESWNRFRDFSRILTGLEACGKTCPKVERFCGTGRVVSWLSGGAGAANFWGGPHLGRSMSKILMYFIRRIASKACALSKLCIRFQMIGRDTSSQHSAAGGVAVQKIKGHFALGLPHPLLGLAMMKRLAKSFTFSLVLLCLFLSFSIASLQAQNLAPQHGAATFGSLKYPPDFRHFDYVNPNAPKGGKITLGHLGTFDSLNPYIIKGTAPEGITRCHATLLASSYDEVASYYGYIATSIEVVSDGKGVIFHLNPKACFSDGQPITTDDVMFSFGILRQHGKPFWQNIYKNVLNVERISAHKIKFTFEKNKSRELIANLAQLPILCKKFYQTHPFHETSLTPAPCSGPYVLETLEAGRSITYRRVQNWWAQNVPSQRGVYNFDVIKVDFYRDPNVMLQAFKNGQIDIRMEISSKNWVTEYTFPAFKQGKVKKMPLYGHKVSYGSYGLYFNTRRSLFADRHVRMALSEIFNFEWANNNLFYNLNHRNNSYFPNFPFAAKGIPVGQERKLLEPFKDQLPPEVFTKPFELPVHKTQKDWEESRIKALSFLRKAGWILENQKLIHAKTRNPFTFEFLIQTPAVQKIAIHFQNCLKVIGIEVRITLVDTSIYQERYDKHDYDMILHTLPQRQTLGTEQRGMWSSEAANQTGTHNIAGIRNPVVDDLVEQLVESPDYETMVIRAKALDRVLLWNYYMIPAWQMNFMPWVVWDRFKFPDPMCPPYMPTSIDTWWLDPEKIRLRG